MASVKEQKYINRPTGITPPVLFFPEPLRPLAKVGLYALRMLNRDFYFKGGNMVGEIPAQVLIQKPWASIVEIKDEPRGGQKNELRVYQDQWPDGFQLQIRTNKPINDAAKGVIRKMIANCNVTIDEMEQLLAYMKAKRGY